jgi:uncharacterized repeat protein (TIGR01451 family)
MDGTSPGRATGALTRPARARDVHRPLARTIQGGKAMHRLRLFAWGAAVAAAVSLTAPVARADDNVTVQLSAQRVTKAQGREVLAAAEQARPGETLEYRAVYRNGGAAEARNLAATLPIPRGTRYVPGSAAPSRVEASLDGVRFAAVPLTRVVRGADGRDVVREVPVSEYRALRWSLGSLAGRQSRAVTARVRIEPTEVAALTR